MKTQPLRVLILNYEFPPMGGGAGHASSQIAKKLVDKGCHVDILTSGLKGQKEFEILEGVHIYRVKSLRKSIQDCGLLGAWSYIFSARKVFKALLQKKQYDITHYFFGLPTGVLRLITPGAKEIPSVISLRGSDVPGYDRTHFLLRLFHFLLSPLTRTIWKQAERVVANSHGLKHLAETFFPSKTITVVPNAIESETFYPSRAAHNDKIIKLLCVARLIKRKGLDDLLEALAILKDERLELTLQGSGPDGDFLQRRAVELGIHERVIFSGFQPRNHLPEVYQAADIFVLPSLSESCAMALMEAMGCGLPVIATEVGGTGEHILDGANGLLVPPRNPAALALAIKKLVDDPQKRFAMGAQNAERTHASYTWESVSSSYLKTYQGILNTTRTREVHYATA